MLGSSSITRSFNKGLFNSGLTVPKRVPKKTSLSTNVGSQRGYPGKGALAAIGARRRTVKTIEKITGTMKLVAQAQLQRDAKTAFQTKAIYTSTEPVLSKLPENKDENKKVIIVILTSTRGLCGALNAQLVREATRSSEFPKASVYVYGDKGSSYLEKRPGENEGVFGSAHPGRTFNFNEVGAIVDEIVKQEYDEVKIVFNQFVSTNVFQIAEIRIPSYKYINDNSKMLDHEYDENKQDLYKNFHEFQLASALSYTINQNNASETLSRRNAMDNANKNCKEVNKKLNIVFNKLRQSLITTELIEVTVGAMAVEEMG